MPGLKTFVKSVTPRILWDVYGRCRGEGVKSAQGPRMEMHVVCREEIIGVVESNGGRIVDIVEDGSSGAEFISCCYAVSKG